MKVWIGKSNLCQNLRKSNTNVAQQNVQDQKLYLLFLIPIT